MSVTPTDFADKTLSGKEATSSSKRLIEELGAKTLTLHAEDVYGEAFDTDPAVELAKPLPKIAQDVLFPLTVEPSVGGSQAWKAGTPDWIPDQFGAGYAAQFFDGADVAIGLPEQISRGFRYNYKTAILTTDDSSGLTLPIKISGYRYIGARVIDLLGGGGGGPVDDSDITGGMRSVADVAARNAIPVGERKPGMRVHVRITGIGYKLNADLVAWDPQADLGSYRVVATRVARDAIPADAKFAGLRVRVLSLPYIFEWSGTEWANVETVGNLTQAFIDEINDQTDGGLRYLSAAGDDENDGLTAGTPWATGQRAMDEVPDDPRIGVIGFGATYQMIYLDNGIVPPRDLTRTKLGGDLFVVSRPDLANIVPTVNFGVIGAGVRPLSPDPLTTTNTLNGQWSYAVTPASFPALTDGSHFMWSPFAPEFGFSYTIDGDFSDEVTGDLRVIGSFDALAFGTDVRMYPISIELGGNTSPTSLEIVNDNPADIRAYFQGFLVPPSVNLTRWSGINFDGCFINSGQIRPFKIGNANGSAGGPVHGNKAFFAGMGDEKGDFGFAGGLFVDGLDVRSGYCIGQAGMMCRGTFSIGGDGATADAPIPSMDIGNVDFDGQGGTNIGLRINHRAIVRTSESSRNLNFIDMARAFDVDNAGDIIVGGGRMFGSQRLPSRVLNPYSTTAGCASITAQVDGLENSVDPGQNIVLQNLPSPNADNSWDWSDLPKTDLIQGDNSLAQVVR